MAVVYPILVYVIELVQLDAVPLFISQTKYTFVDADNTNTDVI